MNSFISRNIFAVIFITFGILGVAALVFTTPRDWAPDGAQLCAYTLLIVWALAGAGWLFEYIDECRGNRYAQEFDYSGGRPQAACNSSIETTWDTPEPLYAPEPEYRDGSDIVRDPIADTHQQLCAFGYTDQDIADETELIERQQSYVNCTGDIVQH